MKPFILKRFGCCCGITKIQVIYSEIRIILIFKCVFEFEMSQQPIFCC